MKKSLWTLLLVGTIFSAFQFSACKNDVSPNGSSSSVDTSRWNIDTSTFYTTYTFVQTTTNTAILSGAANGSNFQITFYYPFIPESGKFHLECGNVNTKDACMQIQYNGSAYRPNPAFADSLQGGHTLDKAVITLPSTKFFNTQSPYDTITVSGKFYQP